MVQGELHTLNETSDRPNDTNGKNVDQKSVTRPAGKSGGGKISSRHLRRRTNSHKRRRRHRFPPRGKDGSSGDGSGGVQEDAESSNDLMGSEKSDMPGKSDKSGEKCSDEQNKQKQKPCRRARRKPVLMKKSHSHWWQPQASTEMVQIQSSVQSNEPKSPHKWIPTHLWHAKRFHASPPLFSWSIPLIHSNRGSRASLRLASSDTSPKCTIQDGTWEVNGCAIKLEVKNEGTSSQTTQQSMQTIISILRRLCVPDAPVLNDESTLVGQRAGEGLLHEIDASPLQPIGPATFYFGCSSNVDGSVNAHVSILIHPAIHKKIVSLFATLLPADVDSNDKVTLSTIPLALLRIRGRASTSILCEVMGIAENTGLSNENHGTLIEGGELPGTKSNPVPNTLTHQSSILLKSHQPNQNYQHLPHNLSSSGWDILCHPSICSSLLQSFVNNGGACAIGLAEDARAHLEAYPPLPMFPRDYPDTEEGKSYWEGGASLALANEKEAVDETWKDWAVIRTCVEGSWGRINTPLKRTIRHWKLHEDKERINNAGEESKSISQESPTPMTQKLCAKSQLLGRDAALIRWGSLISPDKESTIVVRGSFGIPFLQLLHGCGRLSQPESDGSANKRRSRPRRKVRPPNSTVQASPLSKNDSEAHSDLCQQLMTSLSLPALLRCELYCEEKGTLNTGDLIFPLDLQDDDDSSEGPDSEDGTRNADGKLSLSTDLEEGPDNDNAKLGPSPLGVVAAGGFSPSRGKCHGIGFVGAEKLIAALDGTMHGIGMPIPQSNGRKNMALKVMVVRGADCRRFAMLSILL